jgi:hypothetical protein
MLVENQCSLWSAVENPGTDGSFSGTMRIAWPVSSLWLSTLFFPVLRLRPFDSFDSLSRSGQALRVGLRQRGLCLLLSLPRPYP